MMLLSFINDSTYLKKDNSLRKRSKCVKITRYIEQTLGKNSRFFGAPPVLKRTHGGVHKGVSPLTALAWLLRGHMLHQFVSLVGSQRPGTVAPQLCILCEHAVLANLVNPIKLGGSGKLRGRCPEWAWFREIKGGSPGGANHGLE